MPSSRIASVGYYQPPKVLNNHDLADIVDTSDEWIQRRVGIRERRIAAADEGVPEIAAAAASNALHNARLRADQIDMVVVATCTAEERSPYAACRVAERLGITPPVAYDVNTACSGFNYALMTVDWAIRSGSAERALVIGAEKLSAFTDWTDRTTCVLVGDGAGAALIEATEGDSGVFDAVAGTMPAMSDAVVIDGDPPTFHQQGQAVFRWATTTLPEVALEACRKSGYEPAQLVGFVPHQANLRIIEPLTAQLGLKPDVVVARDVVESGNTSAASVPMAFAKLTARGELPSGAPTLLLGFGGGLSYAAQVVLAP